MNDITVYSGTQYYIFKNENELIKNILTAVYILYIFAVLYTACNNLTLVVQPMVMV